MLNPLIAYKKLLFLRTLLNTTKTMFCLLKLWVSGVCWDIKVLFHFFNNFFSVVESGLSTVKQHTKL